MSLCIQTQFVYYRMDPFGKLAHSGKWLIVWQEPLVVHCRERGDWIHEFFLKPADIFLIPAPFSIGQSSIKSPWQWKFKWNFLSSGLFIYCPPISLRILGKPKQWAMGTKKLKNHSNLSIHKKNIWKNILLKIILALSSLCAKDAVQNFLR